jgi:hypothetical protein
MPGAMFQQQNMGLLTLSSTNACPQPWRDPATEQALSLWHHDADPAAQLTMLERGSTQQVLSSLPLSGSRSHIPPLNAARPVSDLEEQPHYGSRILEDLPTYVLKIPC